MIKLFNSTDLTFDSNGDKIINATKAIVHKEDNGDFYLDFECDLSYINDIVENNILVANTPQGDQAFRIGNVSKTKYKISTKAKHVFYDSQNYLIADSYVVDKDCAGAMYHLLGALENLYTKLLKPYRNVGVDILYVITFLSALEAK